MSAKKKMPFFQELFYKLLGVFVLFLLFILIVGVMAEDSSSPVNKEASIPPAVAKAEAVTDNPNPEPNPVVNTFHLVSQIKGTSLHAVLKTELPDNAPISISASRLYRVKDKSTGRTEDASAEYFSASTTAGALKLGQDFPLNNKQWQQTLDHDLGQQANIGLVFVKGSINRNVRIYITVLRSFSLAEYKGKAIQQQFGENAIWQEVNLPYPVNAKPNASHSTDPYNLDVGATYIIDHMVPLMPHYNPKNKMQGLYAKVNLPMGTELTIRQRITFDGSVWYHVRAMLLGLHQDGWVMAQAL